MKISFKVKGEPKTWGNKEWGWRESIAKEVRKKCKGSFNVKNDTRFCVTIKIFKKNHLKMNDLDNLAKPILDTIFDEKPRSEKAKNPTGQLFEKISDERITKLIVQKESPKNNEEGAEIEISWDS